MKSRREKFEVFQKSVVAQLEKLNEKLEKLCALTVSNQLLQECISPDGNARTAEECGEIVSESFMAGVCLAEELNDRIRQFEYQKSEFFIQEDEEVDEQGDGDDDNDDDDDNDVSDFNSCRRPVNAF